MIAVVAAEMSGPARRRISSAARSRLRQAAEKPSGCLHVSGHKSIMAAIDRSWHLASSVHYEAVFLHISPTFPIGSLPLFVHRF